MSRPLEERVLLVAGLKAGARDRVLDLLRMWEANEHELITDRQGIFLSDRDVAFFFEGPDAGESVRQLLNDPVRSTVISPWLPLLDGPLHVAYEEYFRDRDAEQ